MRAGVGGLAEVGVAPAVAGVVPVAAGAALAVAGVVPVVVGAALAAAGAVDLGEAAVRGAAVVAGAAIGELAMQAGAAVLVEAGVEAGVAPVVAGVAMPVPDIPRPESATPYRRFRIPRSAVLPAVNLSAAPAAASRRAVSWWEEPSRARLRAIRWKCQLKPHRHLRRHLHQARRMGTTSRPIPRPAVVLTAP